jgi:hypothetical protein
MEKWSTLHIFGYGESQLIGEKLNHKTLTSSLPSAAAVASALYAKKPADSDASEAYHAINIFNDMFADYQPSQGKGFRIQKGNLDAALIDALAQEILATKPAE